MQVTSEISLILSTVGVQWNSSVASYTNVEQHRHQLCYSNPKNEKQ